MKELSIEEKAKAYDEIVARAKKYLEDCPDRVDARGCIEHLFHKLAESEDERNERIRLGLIEVLKTVPSGIFEDRGKITLDEAFYWLERKEFKKQDEQKPVEWSEEDKLMLESIIQTLKLTNGAAQIKIDWLKSLKDRHTWKPSDGNIEALNEVIRNPYLSTAEYNGLIALRKQLKAL